MNLPPIPQIDQASVEAATVRQNTLTKPQGSLGRLEDIAIKIAGIQGVDRPGFDSRYTVVAAADHGVTEEGVSAYPQSVTAQMVANFLAGSAAINVLADSAGLEVIVVDAGVAGDLPDDDRIRRVAVAKGTANFTHGPAMNAAVAENIVEAGIELATSLAGPGRAVVVPGEMGIGNTTSAAAVTAAITGTAPSAVTGSGTGVNEEAMARKISAVELGLSVNRPDSTDGLNVLSKVGGFEIGFLAGMMIGVASQRGTLVLDGYISTSAALIAATLDGSVTQFMIAGHRSVEPGHAVALEHLGLEPLLSLGMRLGEGSGGALALAVIDAAIATHNGMSTFDEASVSGPSESDSGE